jgi:hypothetical protein
MALAHNPSIVTSGLVLCLDAANKRSYPGSGTSLLDVSGNGNNGTLINGVGYSGDNLGSLVFDGVNDYVNLSGNSQWTMFGSTSSTIGNNFSISCIIKPQAIGSDQALVSQRHGDRMSLWLMNDGKITFEMDDTADYVGTNTALQNNKWYMISIVFYNNTSSSFVEYYVNGAFERSETKWDGNGLTGNSDLWIGWQSRTNYGRNPSFFSGSISNVQIYNRALTAQEISQNFEALRGRFGI